MGLWEDIVSAGGTDAYINAELKKHGFLVKRGDTAEMSARELEEYKKTLKREAAERRELRKRVWQVYKETHLIHLGEGIFWNDDLDQDRFDLPDAETRAAANELPRLDSPAELAAVLKITIPQLRQLTFHRDAAKKINYRRFTIPKRDGSERNIWEPLDRLKKIQRWILTEILEHLPVHSASHGFLRGRSTLSNALVHRGARVVVRVDLKDFFPTVTFRRVKGVFRKAGYREQIATLLALLCTEAPRKEVVDEGQKLFIAMGPRCLPQGAPTSPAITNTISLRLDKRLASLATKLGWRYTRYADDLTFSLPAEQTGRPGLGLLLGSIGRVVRSEGFNIHREKTRVSRRGGRQRITGLVVNGDLEPRVPRELKRRIRAILHNLKQGKPLHEGDTLNRIRGYAAYIFMTDPVLGARFLKELG